MVMFIGCGFVECHLFIHSFPSPSTVYLLYLIEFTTNLMHMFMLAIKIATFFLHCRVFHFTSLPFPFFSISCHLVSFSGYKNCQHFFPAHFHCYSFINIYILTNNFATLVRTITAVFFSDIFYMRTFSATLLLLVIHSKNDSEKKIHIQASRRMKFLQGIKDDRTFL